MYENSHIEKTDDEKCNRFMNKFKKYSTKMTVIFL